LVVVKTPYSSQVQYCEKLEHDVNNEWASQHAESIINLLVSMNESSQMNQANYRKVFTMERTFQLILASNVILFQLVSVQWFKIRKWLSLMLLLRSAFGFNGTCATSDFRNNFYIGTPGTKQMHWVSFDQRVAMTRSL
jgi:hypothetical protein